MTAARTLKPQPVGPKAVRRWIVQALDLVGRGFHVWVAMMLCFCLAQYGMQRSAFLGQVLALTAYFVGIGVASLVDDYTHPGFFAILRRAWADVPAALFMGVVLLFVATGGDLVLDLLFGKAVDFKRFYDASAPLLPLGDDLLIAMRRLFGVSLGAFLLASVVMVAPFVSSIFHYHCMSILGMTWRAGYWNGNPLIEAANFWPIFAFLVVLVSPTILLLLVAPFLAPVFFCFASAFSYVAFREIYLGIGENRKIVASEVRALAGAAA